MVNGTSTVAPAAGGTSTPERVTARLRTPPRNPAQVARSLEDIPGYAASTASIWRDSSARAKRFSPALTRSTTLSAGDGLGGGGGAGAASGVTAGVAPALAAATALE